MQGFAYADLTSWKLFHMTYNKNSEIPKNVHYIWKHNLVKYVDENHQKIAFYELGYALQLWYKV